MSRKFVLRFPELKGPIGKKSLILSLISNLSNSHSLGWLVVTVVKAMRLTSKLFLQMRPLNMKIRSRMIHSARVFKPLLQV